MNKIYYISLLLFSAIFIYSCDKFTDVHKEWVKNGEIVYAPKPDSVVFIAGRDRVKMRLWMYNAVNVKNIIVSWNAGHDSLLIPASFKNGRDSIDVVIGNLTEKSYTFNVYSIDNFGHRSLNYVQFGSSYGDIFISSIGNRRVKSLTLTDLNGSIDWYASPSGLVFTEIRYTNRDGAITTVRMPSSDFRANIDVKAGTTFDFRSLYIPESESVDTFYTSWDTHPTAFPTTYRFSRNNWTVLSVSDQTASDGGGMTKLIDGNLGTYWHSQWDGGNAPLPHWAIIDLAKPISFAYMEVYRRAGNTDAKTVQIFQGDNSDPASPDWVLTGQGVFSTGDKQTINITNPVSKRYLKIFLPDSNRDPFISIAEIYGYGN